MIVNRPTFPLTPPLPAGLTPDGLPTPELLATMDEQEARLFSAAVRSCERLRHIPHYSSFTMLDWLNFEGGRAAQKLVPGTYEAIELTEGA